MGKYYNRERRENEINGRNVALMDECVCLCACMCARLSEGVAAARALTQLSLNYHIILRY